MVPLKNNSLVSLAGSWEMTDEEEKAFLLSLKNGWRCSNEISTSF